MNKYRISPLANRPRSAFSGLIGDIPRPEVSESPSPQAPPETSPELSAKIHELASVIGLAKVFGNHDEIKAVLDKIQSKLTKITDPTPTITEDTLSGLDRSIAYFNHALPFDQVEIRHSQNKAGAFLNFAASLTTNLKLYVEQEPGINRDRQLLKQFLSRLHDLLLTLEQWEYQKSNLVS